MLTAGGPPPEIELPGINGPGGNEDEELNMLASLEDYQPEQGRLRKWARDERAFAEQEDANRRQGIYEIGDDFDDMHAFAKEHGLDFGDALVLDEDQLRQLYELGYEDHGEDA